MNQARQIALKVLYEIDKKGAYSNIALDEALTQARKTRRQNRSKRYWFDFRNCLWNRFMETNLR